MSIVETKRQISIPSLFTTDSIKTIITNNPEITSNHDEQYTNSIKLLLQKFKEIEEDKDDSTTELITSTQLQSKEEEFIDINDPTNFY